MGGDLLRREILSEKKPAGKAVPPLTGRRRRRFPSFYLIAALGCFVWAGILPADENGESEIPAAARAEEASRGEAPLFPPPFGQKQGAEPLADGPDEHDGFPPLPGPPENAASYPESPLLTPEALENPLTQRYIRQFSGPDGIAVLSAAMDRGSPYLAFIRREIAERGLPEELLYLPVIESGYLSTAVSRSGAAGLWQFMRNSIAPFDMRVNEWIDERRDFWKSTQGALRKLEENYKFFGNWPLALAAYNAGLGAVDRVVRQSGSRDYWELSRKKLLKNETIQYVPKLAAAAYILSNPRRFGMEPFRAEDPGWKRVEVDRPVDIRLVAREAGMDAEELLRANRELLYNVTPPGQGYFLKVPEKDAEGITAVLARKDLPLIRYYVYTIRSGDTLLALANHYGITVNHIAASNPGIEARRLRIGSRLLIPALKETAPYTRPAPSGENLVYNGNHLVKRGETLWSIALAYGVDPEVLAEANGMGLSDILREGRTLKTPIR